jgi:DNA-binding response OmpR family regulator
MHKRILIIEDNPVLVANLFAYLEARSYSLDAAQDGQAGLRSALGSSHDAIVLDWMLPRLDGEEVLKELRARGVTTPILMLTARDDLPHKIAGFRAGADDYLTKPFAFVELEVRLDALILRSRGRAQVLVVDDLRFDLATQEVTRGGTALQIFAGGKKLLEELMRSSPAVVSRDRLESTLWGNNPPHRELLRSHMYALRRSVDGPFAAKLIHTVPKLGYRVARLETGQ